MSTRVGLGFDVHRFSDDHARVLVLGGVRFDGERGLAGHSDADVVAHSVSDALLGAAGLGDLGSLFPSDDEQWTGADSLALLADVSSRVRAAGWRVINVDAAVVLDHPKLAPVRADMEKRLSGVVGADVSVKPKRAEAVGALGRGEGIACWAVVLIERSET